MFKGSLTSVFDSFQMCVFSFDSFENFLCPQGQVDMYCVLTHYAAVLKGCRQLGRFLLACLQPQLIYFDSLHTTNIFDSFSRMSILLDWIQRLS